MAMQELFLGLLSFILVSNLASSDLIISKLNTIYPGTFAGLGVCEMDNLFWYGLKWHKNNQNSGSL